MDTDKWKQLLGEWALNAEPEAIYIGGDPKGTLVFSVNRVSDQEVINAEPPTKLTKLFMRAIDRDEKFFAHKIDPQTGTLTVVAKLTDERRRVFDLMKVIRDFKTSLNAYKSTPLGAKNASKIIKALRNVGVLGGTDIRSTYDSCSFGGALVDVGNGEMAFGEATLHDEGTRRLETYFSAQEPEFKTWLAKQSERILACSPNTALSHLPVFYKLHVSLIKAIRSLP